MNRLLQALGLSPDDRIERLTNERNAALAERDVESERFKKAISDLAAAREAVEKLRGWKSTAEIYAEDIAKLNGKIAGLERCIESLRPDALAMRRKRERDRDRRKGKV